MLCWATAYTIMRSWKDQSSYDIRMAVALVGDRYAQMYDANDGLPAGQFEPFLNSAKMTHEPMANLTINGWAQLMQSFGLLWVGTLVSPTPRSGLHSRILQGIVGDGSPGGTSMKVVDPATGGMYSEEFSTFIAKYEGAFRDTGSDQYYQIRHFI
eukprot:TRINITY_DN1486_c0_g2_i1.p1 TRINITY_DN1486_c0_g2~~TRINITY_DN1486_c0_g2_i1.p1  ORF type:complete len:155 (+),score=2.69 TRINITY_DN1486_c0_g2_i1:90-554(+)